MRLSGQSRHPTAAQPRTRLRPANQQGSKESDANPIMSGPTPGRGAGASEIAKIDLGERGSTAISAIVYAIHPGRLSNRR